MRAAKYLKASINIQRPICTLTKLELENLVEAITAEWIVAVCEKRNEPPGVTPLTTGFLDLLV